MEDQPESDVQHAQLIEQEQRVKEAFHHLWHAEETLLLTCEDLFFLAETIPQLVWISQPDGFNTAHNRRWYEYTGARPEEGESELWVTFLHPDDRARALTTWYTARETGQPYEVEYRVREGKTGTYHWFLARALPLLDHEGHILKWFGTYTDIDKQKRAEEELRQSHEALHRLLDAMPQLVWTTSPDGTDEYINQRWYEYTGRAAEDLQDGKWITCFHPDDREKILTFWHHARLIGQSFEMEVRLREGKTGTYRWFLSRGLPLTDPYGKVWRWIGTCTDIHEQKRTEAALHESKQRFHRLMDSTLIGVTLTNLEGTVIEANQAFLSMVGFNRQELLSGHLHWTTMTPPEYRERDQQALEQLQTTGAYQPYEKEYLTKDGKRVPVLIEGAFVHGEDEKPRILSFILDVTTHTRKK